MKSRVRTGVAIIGGGPSGLLLGHLLRAEGIDAVVIEQRSPDYVLSRIRAGVLERTTTDLLDQLGLGARKDAEGLSEDGFGLAWGDRMIRIDTRALTGRAVTVYGQTEVTRDLIDAAPERGLQIIWNADNVALHDIESEAPFVSFTLDGVTHRLDARFIAGCDGFHGPSRRAIPAGVARVFERVYPFAWFGVLADVPPCHKELIYARHDRGFALASLRSRTRSRYYIQTPLDADLAAWSDDRFWDEVSLRLGPAGANVTRGPSIEKSLAPLRSWVFEPMRHGSLFLAGDAAHIVPPTGAKGLNLAASDVTYLGQALASWFNHHNADGLAGYSTRALARVWQAERFSWTLTRLMHVFPDEGAFEQRMQLAELDYIAGSVAAQTVIAENYVGLPL